ncbi:MAG: Rieske 2Fe-2S domain-containing protein [Thermostichus sp. BF3_bins_97]
MGSPLVLWWDEAGQPVCVEDRCCHRTARLSQGCVVAGAIQCPYHGWQFDGRGVCVKVPRAA